MTKTIEWANRRQRQILVHSFLYYQLNTNIINDHVFDLWCKELADWISNNPEPFKLTAYYAGFTYFDGSSGYDLPYADPAIQSVGHKLVKLHSRYKKEGSL